MKKNINCLLFVGLLVVFAQSVMAQSSQRFDFDNGKLSSQIAMQEIQAPTVTNVTDVSPRVVLPPAWTIKTKLTPEELKKFLELAKYAHKNNDTLSTTVFITNWLGKTVVWGQKHTLNINGIIQNDGSLTLTGITTKVDKYYLNIKLDGSLSLEDYSQTRMFSYAEDMRTQKSQEIIKRMIDVWMTYKIPSK